MARYISSLGIARRHVLPEYIKPVDRNEFTPHYESDQEHNGNLDSGIQLTAAKDEDRDDKDRDRTEQEEEEEGEAQWYTYPCRCSGQFKITVEQLEQNVEVVGCEWCGEWIRVGYEVVLDDADSNAGEDADEEERE
ncbi:uncharacterized protein I303_100096 [Kwoniella dejecticola CBS 10117]|uniref:DPH-type MB domain-containing protein n=1 Tax=Kwoniella dejecticola CBS 10117 TaxID=1296121 RepID=A0AAJ8KFW0_9TREE